MDKKQIVETLKKLKEGTKQRKFAQSVDMIINLKDLDLKKQTDQVEFFMQLPHSKGKKTKVCALVGPELVDDAKKVCDTTVLVDEFPKYAKDLKLVKKLAKEHDFFIAQANIMPKVAQSFGRVLGTRKKMPNPKAGCVVPPKAALGPLYEKLQKTLRISAKSSLVLQLLVGGEKEKEEDVAENISTIYNQLIHHLPNEKNNVRSILIKLTMGAPLEVKF